jgi:FAD synthase
MAEMKKSVLTIRVPQRLKSRIEKYSALEGVSINQFALYAFAKEIAELETNQYFRERLRGKKKDDLVAAFDAALAKVPDRKSPKWDRMENGARKLTPNKQLEQS